jgi:hypothetical protein
MLRAIAIIRLIIDISALRERVVVRVPAPAMRGKTIGTIVECPLGPSFLKISTLKVISTPKAMSIKPPAIAKDAKSTPKTFNNPSPKNINSTIKKKEIMEAFPACTFLPVEFKSIMIGTAPVMSIMAKRTMKAVKICLKSKAKSIIIIIWSYVFEFAKIIKNNDFYLLKEKTIKIFA